MIKQYMKHLFLLFLITTLLIGIVSATELEDKNACQDNILQKSITQDMTKNADEKIKTKISVKKINNTQYTKNTTITGKYVDTNGRNLKNTTLNIKVNDRKYKAKTDTMGVYTLNYRTNCPGKNNVTISYPGNDRYIGASIKSTFTVTCKNTIIKLGKVSDTYYKSYAKITGYYVDSDNKRLINTRLSIMVNKKKYVAKTDENGYFNIKIRAYFPGVNNVTVSYGGNNKYSKASNETTFNAKCNPTRIIINKIHESTYKKNVTISGRYVDVNNKSLMNTRLKLKVNNRTYTMKTGVDGCFKRVIRANIVGINNVTVTYPGNVNYSWANEKSIFTVNPMKTKIKFGIIGKHVHAGDLLEVKGIFTDADGNSLKNTRLNVSFDDDNFRYTLVTNKSGEFDTEFETQTPGKRMITIFFAGNEKYFHSSSNKTFIADKMWTSININSPGAVKLGKNYIIDGDVYTVDSEGYYLPRNINKFHLIISVNGENIAKTVTENERFIVTSTANKMGFNNITIKCLGSNRTLESVASNTFYVYDRVDEFLSFDFEEDSSFDNEYESYYMGTFKEYNETHIESFIIVNGAYDNVPVTRIVKAKFYLKNRDGDIITRTSSNNEKDIAYIHHSREYIPYKVDLTLKELSDYERDVYYSLE